MALEQPIELTAHVAAVMQPSRKDLHESPLDITWRCIDRQRAPVGFSHDNASARPRDADHLAQRLASVMKMLEQSIAVTHVDIVAVEWRAGGIGLLMADACADSGLAGSLVRDHDHFDIVVDAQDTSSVGHLRPEPQRVSCRRAAHIKNRFAWAETHERQRVLLGPRSDLRSNVQALWKDIARRYHVESPSR